MAEDDATGGPLSGIRICDFTGQLAGAGATRTLAALGAEVIRIEDPVSQGRWDILRGSGVFKDERRGINLSGAFNSPNIGKLGITLNLRTEKAKVLLRRLVAISDAVTENFAAGVLARLGFGYAELTAIKPDIVYVSNSGFGDTGPYAPYQTWGPIVQAMSGLTFSSGLPDLPPAGWGYSYMDHTGANFMAMAILGALLHRDRTGEGQWVDMACTEPGVALTGPAILDASVNGRPLRRPGQPHSNRSRSPAMAPHGIYPATGEDHWVAIACRDDDDWAALGRVVKEGWCAEAEVRPPGRAPGRRGRAGCAGRRLEWRPGGRAWWPRPCGLPGCPPPPWPARESASTTIRPPPPGACGRRWTTPRWARCGWTGCPSTSRGPTGRSSGRHRASASTTARCSPSSSGWPTTRWRRWPTRGSI